MKRNPIMAMVDKRAGPAFLYVVGDPYSRVAMSKIGITENLRQRMESVFTGNLRRHKFLPEGIAAFSCYRMKNRQQAAILELTLLHAFHDHKTDRRTLGWLALKPGMIDLAIDVTAERLGIECEQCNFNYVRWSDVHADQ